MTDGYAEKSVELTADELAKINAYTRSELDAEDIYAFNISFCNNDIDRDNEKFSVEALYELAELFAGKTGIMDHSMKACDQSARIYDTWVEKENGRKTADGEDFYILKAKAYMVKNESNSSLITDIEVGIKKGSFRFLLNGQKRLFDMRHRQKFTPLRAYARQKL
ncbi:MAG: hypothetical protein LUG95_07510 [Clostridiales bacterium]|nr:hypothetical protein [Clostridiales bacterium]